MNSKLTRNQQKTICSQLGNVKLQLLYKASVHGFTGAAFHQRCDNRCPTVSVGYNASGYVFGGYTKQPFCQSGQYVNDDQAFLFTFNGEKLNKYPVTGPGNAVRMMGNSGPNFGEALVLVNGSQAVVHSNPGNYYNFNAADMHGNDLQLTECEVYEVEESTELEKPWRTIVWESEKRKELMDSIRSYKPMVSSVPQCRVLLIGAVGAGKSSFFNSVNSVFRGHIINQAITGSSTTSLTTQFRTYTLKAGREGKPLPIILCDTMGLEEGTRAGLDIDDISNILKSHLPDPYQFNPSAPLQWEASGYRRSPGLKDKIHCVAYIMDACKISIIPTKLQEKLDAICRKVNLMDIEVRKHQRFSQHPLETSADQPSTMNSMLTRNQQKTICSQLGNLKLQLLYKASVHGFTGPAFHQHGDNRCPTVSVGYNTSGYVFGGYTKQPFCQSGQFVYDDQAFLFTFNGEKLKKYPVTDPRYAVKMIGNSGPYFGEALVLVNGNQAVVHSNPGNHYNFNAADMHGNDLQLTECEVYQVQVEESTELERPWRTIVWESEKRKELMDRIRSYKPMVSSVPQCRVLLIGAVGAGKSSFFNSVNSVFRGHVTSQATSGSSTTSLTTQFRTYSLKAGREGKPLPIILCDTMGLEESTRAGLDIDDISSILRGHLPDRYQFNPSAPLQSEASSYRKSPGLKDKIHCVAYIMDACKISIMPKKLQEKLDAIRRKVNLMGIPQLVLLTKVDEACPLVMEDVRNVYKSVYIKEMMQEASARLGLPLSCVVPLKNYSEELELDTNTDILLLSAIIQMLRFADNYFDDISDKFSNIETKE
ncbi:interferon-induced protein 44-like isoform X3 [Thunnus albacares]|uniref:interferon-induced protein 44-like isoform X3 n=1 Tax=Thunnus albacares TaxID=8236 RepID=UPI001CF708B0|nr:interferon-induced protein 44-like isoform X3 [Thunnus albacares]